MTIDEMLDEIREIVSQVDRDIPELDVMSALEAEAECWRMRLEELQSEDNG